MGESGTEVERGLLRDEAGRKAEHLADQAEAGTVGEADRRACGGDHGSEGGVGGEGEGERLRAGGEGDTDDMIMSSRKLSPEEVAALTAKWAAHCRDPKKSLILEPSETYSGALAWKKPTLRELLAGRNGAVWYRGE